MMRTPVPCRRSREFSEGVCAGPSSNKLKSFGDKNAVEFMGGCVLQAPYCRTWYIIGMYGGSRWVVNRWVPPYKPHIKALIKVIRLYEVYIRLL